MEVVNNGFKGKDYFEQLFTQAESAYKEITRMSQVDIAEYKILLDRLEYVNDNRILFKNKKKEIGDSLENIVSFIFEKTSIFTIVRNIRTSSNEIDQLITFNSKGEFFKNNKFIDLKGDYLISECKNYDKPIGGTWVGKLYSLLSYTNTRIGILFSYHGLSGSGWNEGIGLVKKLFLSKENHNCKIYILDINRSHFRRILNGASFLEIIKEEMMKLSTDTDVTGLLTCHELQEDFKKHMK